ncbi:MAG TPA: hypothetical protein VH092_05845 [Urbifossiella sp.]|jgi:hypothetical protein|nr:hypothetical protein [Urbifossiella sp.]
MAQQRPSTLKLWRFFLDVCEVLAEKTGPVSSHEIAKLLQARYKAMSETAKRLHFGLDQERAADLQDTFPSQATTLRYLEMIEADLVAFFPNRRLIPRFGTGDRVAFGRPESQDVKIVRSIGEGLFRQLTALTQEKRPLLLATNGSVNTFLLPRTRVAGAIGTHFQLRTRKFSPIDVAHSLKAGDIDAAIGWSPGYDQEVSDDPAILPRTIALSHCRVCVLFNPLRIDLGKKKLGYIAAYPEDPDGTEFVLTPDDLRDSTLIYPDLPQLARIGELFEQRKFGKGFQIDDFMSVLNAVRANNGVGLFFGLPWLLRENEHQHRVYSATLKVPADWNVKLEMELKAYTRKNDTSHSTAASTQAADNLVNALEQMLVNHGYPPPMARPEWRLVEPAAIKPDAFKKGTVWHVAYVTSGKFERVVSPRWMTGRIEFDAPRKDGRPSGVLYQDKDDAAKFMDVWADPEAMADGVPVLRFQRLERGSQLGTHTVAYFPSRVTRPGFDGTCLVGSLSFAVSGHPFCSPILLSDRPLGEPGDLREVCKSVARSHVIDFLFGDEPDA